MSNFALVLVVAGLLIILSRAPLIFAPGATRTWILDLFESDGRMRAMGLFVSALGVFLIWGTGGVAGLLAAILYFIGWISFAMGLIGMMIFPTSIRPLINRIFNAFSEPTLRALGAIAVVIGLLLMVYGFSL
jgi:uncharacterized protein YjeT (DUF2065 family)